jgi:hypothetical protein
MAIPDRTTRGLQCVQTLSKNKHLEVPPHKAYIKIACLEMERARRGSEREAAMRRVRIIDERFKAIDAEKEALLASLAQMGENLPASSPAGPRRRPEAPHPKASGSGFGIKY